MLVAKMMDVRLVELLVRTYCGVYRLDNMLTVPYVFPAHDHTGDIHKPRPYLPCMLNLQVFKVKSRNCVSEGLSRP